MNCSECVWNTCLSRMFAVERFGLNLSSLPHSWDRVQLHQQLNEPFLEAFVWWQWHGSSPTVSNLRKPFIWRSQKDGKSFSVTDSYMMRPSEVKGQHHSHTGMKASTVFEWPSVDSCIRSLPALWERRIYSYKLRSLAFTVHSANQSDVYTAVWTDYGKLHHACHACVLFIKQL